MVVGLRGSVPALASRATAVAFFAEISPPD